MPKTPGQKLELSMLFRQLSVGLNSGLSIISVLDILAESNERYRDVVQEVAQRIATGWKLSHALKKQGSVFPPLVWRLAAVGEETGNLGSIFARLADWQEKESKMLSKVVSALVYPGTVVGTTIICFWLMARTVLPTFVKLLSDLGTTLPLPTRILLTIVNLLQSPVFYIFALLVIPSAFFFLKGGLKTENGQRNFEKLLWSVPILGLALHHLALARLFNALYLSISVGMNTLRSLRLGFPACGSFILKDDGEMLIADLQEGTALSEHMSGRPDLYPTFVTGLIRVGEEAGGLDLTYRHLAEFYETEVDSVVQKLLDLLEPLLIASVSLIAGAAMLSLLLPLSKVLQSL